METTEKNRQTILRYYEAISGVAKTKALLSRYVHDRLLVERVLYYEKLFPRYELILDEITCEEDRVIVRGRARGKHTGETEGFPPTFRIVETPFVTGYRIQKGKIMDHWLVTDQMEMLEQLGLVY
jgi:predicted ester cyclase